MCCIGDRRPFPLRLIQYSPSSRRRSHMKVDRPQHPTDVYKSRKDSFTFFSIKIGTAVSLPEVAGLANLLSCYLRQTEACTIDCYRFSPERGPLRGSDSSRVVIGIPGRPSQGAVTSALNGLPYDAISQYSRLDTMPGSPGDIARQARFRQRKARAKAPPAN